MNITVRLLALGIAAALAITAPAFADGRDVVEKPKKAATKSAAKAKKPAKKAVKPQANAKPVQPVNGANAKKEKPVASQNANAKAKKPAVTKAEKPTPPPEAFVLLESKPANAEVVIDGLYTGSTPIQLPLKEGVHKLKLLYPGYLPWERQIKAYRGMRVSAVMEELKPETAQK